MKRVTGCMIYVMDCNIGFAGKPIFMTLTFENDKNHPGSVNFLDGFNTSKNCDEILLAYLS